MFEKILFVSDLIFPVWLLILTIFLNKWGLIIWKAWGIASTFCLVQAYLVAQIVGWNLGGYILIFISSIPSMLFGKTTIPEKVTSILFWTIPPLIFVIIPTLILYFFSRSRKLNSV